MCHSRKLNNRINRLHERALRIVYKNSDLTFQELLDLDGSFTIHHRNLQKLATEMYKIKTKVAPSALQELFPENISSYNLRNQRLWGNSNLNTEKYGIETITFLGPKTWDILPKLIKESLSLPEFEIKVKNWKPEGCACRLCKTYIVDLGYIN